MKISKPVKKQIFVILCVLFSLPCLFPDSPRLGPWTRESTSFVELPFFTLERMMPRPFSTPETFSARLSGLEPGVAYVVSLPYAAGLSIADPAGEGKYDSSGSVSIIAAPKGSALSVSASVSPGLVSPELSLRGARVQSVYRSAAALAVPWFVLSLFTFLFVVRAVSGIRSAFMDRMRIYEAFNGLASVAALLLVAAAFRYVSLPAFPLFPAEVESRLRTIGGILFAVAASGGILAAKPFRGGAAVFIAYVVVGAFACAASALPFLPAPLPLAAFGLLSFLVSLVVAVVLFVSRLRFDAVLSLFAAMASVSLSLSAFVVDPAFESLLSVAAPVPFILASFRVRRPTVRKEAAEPVLSDYVDLVSIALTRFVPKEFLAILNKENASELKLGDHVKKDMTIFFSDIRSFTSLSEGLTPEENFRFINSYLSRVVPVVTDHGGFVDKYIGDAIMALFPSEGGADAAVRASIEMQKRIVEYNGHRANCGYRPLAMGIGLHTGTLMLGVVGVEDRMQSTVISDAVNLASRLESITKVFNVSLAISEETFKSLADPGAYMYRFIGKVRVKGKLEPVSVFEIFDGVDEALLDRKMKANRFFEQGMLAYYQKDFPGAMFYFRKVIEVLPEDGASAFYLDNCLAKARV